MTQPTSHAAAEAPAAVPRDPGKDGKDGNEGSAASAASAANTANAGNASETRAGPAPQKGWLDSLQSIWRELPGLVSDRVDLLSLELQRAGRVLAQIVALLVAATILGITAWMTLWAGIAVGLVELGLHWSLSLLLVLALNAGIAWLAIGRLRTLLPLLRLPATRRHLTPGRTTEPPVPSMPSPSPSPSPSSGTSASSAPPLGQPG